MRFLPFAPFLLTIALTACASMHDAARFPAAQAAVDRVAARHPDLRRLTLHAVPSGKTECMQLASTEAARRGKPSDREDMTALRTGNEIVLDEPGAVDVTVPILLSGGAPTAVAGVTVNTSPATAHDTTTDKARAIARELESELRNADKPLW